MKAFFEKLNTEPSYDPATPLLGIYATDLEAGTQTDICMSMFITALFTAAKRWRQPKCLSVDE